MGINPETLRNWVQQAEIDAGDRSGVTTDDAARIAEAKREVREIRQAKYRPIRDMDRLAEAGGVASVGCRGDSDDNGLAEAANSIFTAEPIRNC